MLEQLEPADGVLRLTISHPGGGGARDHGILDALAAALAPAPARGARRVAERRPARWHGA